MGAGKLRKALLSENSGGSYRNLVKWVCGKSLKVIKNVPEVTEDGAMNFPSCSLLSIDCSKAFLLSKSNLGGGCSFSRYLDHLRDIGHRIYGGIGHPITY